MSVGLEARIAFSVLEVEGSLRAPVSTDLYGNVATLLARGERRIILDLAQIPNIDAAGIGELVRAVNLTSAAGGELRIAHATDLVRQLLLITGLSSLLE
jgi:anti-sigma B factor antagonist